MLAAQRPQLGPGRVVAHGGLAQQTRAAADLGLAIRRGSRSQETPSRAPSPRPAAAPDTLATPSHRSAPCAPPPCARTPRPCGRRRPRPPTAAIRRQLGGQLAHRLGRHGLDAVDHLGRVDQPVEQQQLARHLLGARGRAFQPHQQAGLELRLGARHLGLRRLLGGGARQLLADHLDQLAHHLRPGRGMNAEQPRIGQRPAARIDRVAEAAPLPHLLEQPRRHAPAEQPREHLRGVEILAAVGRPRERQHQMALLERLGRACACPRHSAPARIGPPTPPFMAAELGLSVAHQLVVVDLARGGQDHARWRRSWALRNVRRSPAPKLGRRSAAVPRIGRPMAWSGKAASCSSS